MAKTPAKSRSLKPRTRFALTDVTTPTSRLFRLGDKRTSKEHDGATVIVEHDGARFKYVSTHRLGAYDWRVFCAIAALAGIDKETLSRDTAQPMLWDKFFETWSGHAAKADGLQIQTTFAELLREIGRPDGGKDHAELKESLDRLRHVSQSVEKHPIFASGENLLWFAGNDVTKEIRIGLAPQMARAILGDAGQFARHSLVELRQLGNAGAVLLHAYFSSKIRPGKRGHFPIDSLVRVVYGIQEAEEQGVSAATMRKRRQRVRESLRSFAGWTTWQISFSDTGETVTVNRIDRVALERWEAEIEAEEAPRHPHEPHPKGYIMPPEEAD